MSCNNLLPGPFNLSHVDTESGRHEESSNSRKTMTKKERKVKLAYPHTVYLESLVKWKAKVSNCSSLYF